MPIFGRVPLVKLQVISRWPRARQSRGPVRMLLINKGVSPLVRIPAVTKIVTRFEWWDRGNSLRLRVHDQEISALKKPQSNRLNSLRCFVSSQISSRFSLWCFVIDVYNRLLKNGVTNVCMRKAFVHPDFDSMSGGALIWTSVVSSPSSDNLNMPGYNLGVSDKESIDPKYLCNSCGLLLREAMQTACGHFYCRSCLGNLFM